MEFNVLLYRTKWQTTLSALSCSEAQVEAESLVLVQTDVLGLASLEPRPQHQLFVPLVFLFFSFLPLSYICNTTINPINIPQSNFRAFNIKPPCLAQDPTLSACPNFTSEGFHLFHDTYSATNNISPEEAIAALTDAWKLNNEVQRAAWSLPVLAGSTVTPWPFWGSLTWPSVRPHPTRSQASLTTCQAEWVLNLIQCNYCSNLWNDENTNISSNNLEPTTGSCSSFDIQWWSDVPRCSIPLSWPIGHLCNDTEVSSRIWRYGEVGLCNKEVFHEFVHANLVLQVHDTLLSFALKSLII